MSEAASTVLPRDRIGGRYRILAFRGAGAEGSVYLADDLFTGQQVALKLGTPDRLAAEYNRSAALAHPHLARATALWPDGERAALSLEYAAEDLTALRGSPENLIVRHVAEIARALAHLHRHGIVHADVKPQNALLASTHGLRRALLIDLARQPRVRRPRSAGGWRAVGRFRSVRAGRHAARAALWHQPLRPIRTGRSGTGALRWRARAEGQPRFAGGGGKAARPRSALPVPASRRADRGARRGIGHGFAGGRR